MINDYNPNIYWTVDGRRYYRKIDALHAANARDDLSFNYFNDQFNNFNWLIEPLETFDELCALRAHQLRDSGKYLRLWYSGGSDSHTVLTTFLNNNIHLDEIACARFSPINNFDSEGYQEINLTAVPFLKSIQHTIPKTKISLHDPTAEQYLAYLKQDDWYNNTNDFVFGGEFSLLDNPESIDRSYSLITNPNIVEITGDAKAAIIRKDGIYYAPIVDSAFPNMYWNHCETFFTTPEFPQLHSKQCHELKHILERRFPKDQDITHEIYNPQTIDPDFKKEWYYSCRRIINYEIDLGKGWDLLGPKGNHKAAICRDKNPEILSRFLGTLSELQSSIPHLWPDISKDIPGVLADVYSLGYYDGPESYNKRIQNKA